MAKIEWTDNLNLNIEVIDKQHKMFLIMANVLHDAIKEGKSVEIQSELIDKLIGYAFYHFTREEKYLDQSNFPDIIQHKKEHKAFVDKVTKFKKDHEIGRVTLSFDMIEFMSNWWINHIKVSDKKYMPYVKDMELTHLS